MAPTLILPTMPAPKGTLSTPARATEQSAAARQSTAATTTPVVATLAVRPRMLAPSTARMVTGNYDQAVNVVASQTGAQTTSHSQATGQTADSHVRSTDAPTDPGLPLAQAGPSNAGAGEEAAAAAPAAKPKAKRSKPERLYSYGCRVRSTPKCHDAFHTLQGLRHHYQVQHNCFHGGIAKKLTCDVCGTQRVETDGAAFRTHVCAEVNAPGGKDAWLPVPVPNSQVSIDTFGNNKEMNVSGLQPAAHLRWTFGGDRPAFVPEEVQERLAPTPVVAQAPPQNKRKAAEELAGDGQDGGQERPQKRARQEDPHGLRGAFYGPGPVNPQLPPVIPMQEAVAPVETVDPQQIAWGQAAPVYSQDQFGYAGNGQMEVANDGGYFPAAQEQEQQQYQQLEDWQVRYGQGVDGMQMPQFFGPEYGNWDEQPQFQMQELPEQLDFDGADPHWAGPVGILDAGYDEEQDAEFDLDDDAPVGVNQQAAEEVAAVFPAAPIDQDVEAFVHDPYAGFDAAVADFQAYMDAYGEF